MFLHSYYSHFYNRELVLYAMGENRVPADFALLNVRSNYSLLSDEAAVSSPEKLADALAEKKYRYFALADRTMLAEGRVFQAAQAHTLAPIPGLRFSLKVDFGEPQEGILLPRNQEGLRRLHWYRTRENLENHSLTAGDIHENRSHWYTIFTGSLSPFASPLLLEDNVFRGIQRRTDEIAPQAKLAQTLLERRKVVAVPEVRMALPQDAGQLGWLARVKQERLQLITEAYAVTDKQDILEEYQDMLDPVGLTDDIAASIHIERPLPPNIIPESVKPGWSSEAYLKFLATRFAEKPEYQHLRERIMDEAAAMTDPKREGFAAAIFLAKEVIDFCHDNLIPLRTTGSSNNSVLLALLGVTQLTPDEAAECDFDRFLNEQRLGKPDIDMEVGSADRSTILQFLHKKYGLQATEIIVTHTMGVRTVLQYARERKIPITPDEAVAIANENIPFKIQPHGSKVVLVQTAPFMRLTGNDSERGKIVAELDRIDVEKIFDYVAMDYLPRQSPQRLHIAEQLAKKRRVLVPKIDNDPLVMRRIFSGDTMGIGDAESPHMRRTLERMGNILVRPDREAIANAIAISKPQRAVRERFFAYSGGQSVALPPDAVHKMGLSGPVLYQQEDLARVARAAGFSLEGQEYVRKLLSDRDVSSLQRKQAIDSILEGLAAHGYSTRIRQELGMQMDSYRGYVLVRGHAFSLAHGVEQLARYAVYDPVGFAAGVLTTVAEYWDRSDYTFQGYVNDALRHGVHMDFATTYSKIPDVPAVWNNKIAISTSMFLAAKKGKVAEDFVQRYQMWIAAYKDWKRGKGLTQDIVNLQWDLFGASFTHNPVLRFSPEYWLDPQRDKQRVMAQPTTAHYLRDEKIFLLTLDSGTVFHATMDATVGSAEDLNNPFLEIELSRNSRRPKEWEVKQIIAAHA